MFHGKPKKEKETLIYNGTIVTMDPQRRVFRNGAILIHDDIIMDIGQSCELFQKYKNKKHIDLVNLKGRFVLPGFINTHVHTSLQLERGLASDVTVVDWIIKGVLPFEANMTEKDSYISTLACGIELIHSGVTCFAEAGGQFVPEMARAVEELGLRACLTQSNFDAPEGIPGMVIPPRLVRTTADCINSQIELHKKYNDTADGRIKIWFGIRQISLSTEELLLRTRDTAKELRTGVHMHVAEVDSENQVVGLTKGVDGGTVTYLEKIKLLDRNFLAAVAVWLNDAEIGFLSKAKACVSHCPTASMHYFGFARIKEMLAAGVTISLGTDGPSNNRMSMIDEMYVAAVTNKVRTVYTTNATDPTSVPAETILEMATIGGAKALMWENEIGSLEFRKKADLIIVDPFSWTTVPVIDIIQSLVYSMRSENIEAVMCNGQWIMRERKILTVNEETVLRSACRASGDIIKRAGIVVPERMNFI